MEITNSSGFVVGSLTSNRVWRNRGHCRKPGLWGRNVSPWHQAKCKERACFRVGWSMHMMPTPQSVWGDKSQLVNWCFQTWKPEAQSKENDSFPRSCFTSYLCQHHIHSATEAQIQILPCILWLSEKEVRVQSEGETRDEMRWASLNRDLERPWACETEVVTCICSQCCYWGKKKKTCLCFIQSEKKYWSLYPTSHTNDVRRKRIECW